MGPQVATAHLAQPASAPAVMPFWGRSKPPPPYSGTAGSKRPASTEDLVPATTPAIKLHKDASGDFGTAATVTAALQQDPVDTSPPAATTVQVTAAEWTTVQAELKTLSSAVRGFPAQLAATEAAFSKQLQEEKQNSVAREAALKDDSRKHFRILWSFSVSESEARTWLCKASQTLPTLVSLLSLKAMSRGSLMKLPLKRQGSNLPRPSQQ